MSRPKHGNPAVEIDLKDLERVGWIVADGGSDFRVTCKGKGGEKLEYKVSKSATTGSLASQQLKNLRSDHRHKHVHDD